LSTPIQLIVGLGNPGAEYAGTRHNAGAMFVEELARRYQRSLKPEAKFFGLTARIMLQGQELRLLIPTTFMNLSGKAVAPLCKFFKIPPEGILVVHDELDLEPGTARLKTGGGHGGHNGLRDIISALGNRNEFHRLRIGIGHPGDRTKVTNYVLTRAPQDEQNLIEQSIDEAIRVLPDTLGGHFEKAMNRLHSFKAS